MIQRLPLIQPGFPPRAVPMFGALAAGILSQPIAETTFTFLDLETTGLVPGEDDITEIAALKVKNGQVIDRFSTLVKPAKAIPPNVEGLTKITNAMVANAPLPQTALTQLVRFLGPNPVLVGDFLDFDLCQLKDKFPKFGLASALPLLDRDNVFCTRTLEVRLKNAGQQDWLTALKNTLPSRPKHRAENDVLNASDLLFALVRALGNLETVGDLRALQGESLVYRGQ